MQNGRSTPPATAGIRKQFNDPGSKRPFQVLVVDDEFLIRTMVRKVLRQLGISVDMAEDGLQAQKKILAGNYDLVITDIRMPGMDGVELLRWMRRHRPKMEGIVMSGYAIDDAMRSEFAGCVTDFLPKPFTLPMLEEVVKKSMVRFAGREAGDYGNGGVVGPKNIGMKAVETRGDLSRI